MATQHAGHDGASAGPAARFSRAGVAAGVLILLLVPGIVFWTSGAVARAAGAHWVYPFYDPDYQYLLNAVNLIEGAAPRHTDHPGTLVQEFGAAVLIVRHLVAGSGLSVRDDVLRDPESALAAISDCHRAMFALALLALGCLARRLTGSVACAAAAQAVSSLSLVGLFSLWRVDPEPLVMTISVLIGCATLLAISSGHQTRLAALSGVLAGLGLATKVTFLPVCIAPLWGLRGLRRWGLYTGCAVGAFLLATIPIWGQAQRIFGWLTALTVGDGRYGTQRRHLFVDPSRYLFDLRRMATAEPVAIIAAAAGLGLLLHVRASGRWHRLEPAARAAGAALACAAAAELLQYLLVAKHPGARYLLPALALAGVNVPLAFLVFRAAYGTLARRIAWGAVLAAIGAGAIWVGVRAQRDLVRLRGGCSESLAVRAAAAAAARDGALVITRYGSSSPIYALWYADGWTGRRYAPDLARLSPDEITIDEFTARYTRRGKPVPAAQLRTWAVEGRLLFQGGGHMLPPEFDSEELLSVAADGLYRLRPRAAPAPDKSPPEPR